MYRVWSAIATTFVARAIGAALDFVVLLVTAHVLGAEGRGVVAAAMAWTGLTVATFGLSLGQVGAHRYIHEKSRFRATVSALAALSAVLIAAAWIVGWAFHARFTVSVGPLVFIVALGMAPLAIWDTYLGHLLSVSGKLGTYNVLQVAARSAGLAIAMVGLFVVDAGIFAPLAGSFAAFAIVVVAGSIQLLRTTHGVEMPEPRKLLALARDGLKLHTSTLGSFLLFHGAVLLLSELRSMTEAGWYQACVQLVSVPLLLPTVVTFVLYGQMGGSGLAHGWSVQKRVLWQVTAGLAVVAGLASLFAADIIRVLLGPEFLPAAPALQVLLFAMIGMGFSQVMVTQWVGRGYFLQTGLLTLVLGMASFGLNYLLIPAHGFMAAAWISLAIFAIVCVVNLGFIVHIEKRGTPVDGAMRFEGRPPP